MPANPSRVRDVTEAEGLLGTDRVMDIVERVAQREAKRMTERYGPNVLGIAAASRRRGAKQVKRRAEPVVRFVVREKLDEDALEASGYDPIPRTLPTRTLEKGRWIRIAIPTDVVQPPRLRLHAGAKPVRTYVRVSTDDIRAERGSICCLVRDEDKVLYMLSCNHVFGLMRHTAGWTGRIGVRADLRNPEPDKSNVEWIGSVEEAHDLADVHRFGSMPVAGQAPTSLDAAMAMVSGDCLEKISSEINGRRPSTVFRAVTQLKHELDLYLVSPYTKSPKKSKVEAVYRTAQPLPIEDETGTTWWLVFPRLLEYSVASPGPQAGDSGAAVLDSDGKLVGMHFAGAGSIGYAMLAADIFAATTFGRPIRLEPNHN